MKKNIVSILVGLVMFAFCSLIYVNSVSAQTETPTVTPTGTLTTTPEPSTTPTPIPTPTQTPHYYLIDVDHPDIGITNQLTMSGGGYAQKFYPLDLTEYCGEDQVSAVIAKTHVNYVTGWGIGTEAVLVLENESNAWGPFVPIGAAPIEGDITACHGVTDLGSSICNEFQPLLNDPYNATDKWLEATGGYKIWSGQKEGSSYHTLIYIKVGCYGTHEPIIEEPDCSTNYTLGEQLTTYSVPSASNAGANIPMVIAPGEFYALEFTAPPFIDNGTNEPSYEADMAVTWPPVPPLADWVHLKEWPDVCIKDLEDGRYRAYFQADLQTDLGFYGLRAHDMEEPNDYSNNNGDLSYSLYEAEFTPPPSACAADFTVMALRNSAQIWTDRENGYPLPLHGPLEPDLWYMLEIMDFPFWDNGNAAYQIEVSEDNGLTWQLLDDWAACVSQSTWNDRLYYFKSTAGVWLQIRAHDGDGSYWNNEGVLNYNLYHAFNFESKTYESCAGSFTLGSEIETGLVDAKNPDGLEITENFTADSWYAIEITDPIWFDDIAVPSLSADITRDGPNTLPWVTWYDVTSWSGASCVEMVNDDYPRFYFRAQSPLYYRLRAGARDGNFGNNSGYMYYKIYEVEAVTPENPPSSCESSYEPGFWAGSGQVYATLSEGQTLNLVPGRTYRMETNAGPWYDNGAPAYGVEISADGGSNWASLENSSAAGISGCVVPLPDGQHIRIYITTSSTADYRLRVHDGNANFADNSGSINYALYVAKDLDDGETEGETPANFNTGCDAMCNRPEGILEIANWLEYGRCEMFRWVSWCDYHTAATLGIQDMFLTREPFNTILEVKDLIGDIEQEFKSYGWTEDAGGFDLDEAPTIVGDSINLEKYLPALPEDSPYNSGQIQLTKEGVGGYSTLCSIEMGKATGARLAGPICFALNAMNDLGVTPWFQFMFDLANLITLAFYIYRRWVEPGFN